MKRNIVRCVLCNQSINNTIYEKHWDIGYECRKCHNIFCKECRDDTFNHACNAGYKKIKLELI